MQSVGYSAAKKGDHYGVKQLTFLFGPPDLKALD